VPHMEIAGLCEWSVVGRLANTGYLEYIRHRQGGARSSVYRFALPGAHGKTSSCSSSGGGVHSSSTRPSHIHHPQGDLDLRAVDEEAASWGRDDAVHGETAYAITVGEAAAYPRWLQIAALGGGALPYALHPGFCLRLSARSVRLA